MNELNEFIDTKLPSCPQFQCYRVLVADESFKFHACNVLECICALWQDPQFAKYLLVKPERHYADIDETICMFHDMHTRKWWWNTQVSTLQVNICCSSYNSDRNK